MHLDQAQKLLRDHGFAIPKSYMGAIDKDNKTYHAFIGTVPPGHSNFAVSIHEKGSTDSLCGIIWHAEKLEVFLKDQFPIIK